MSNNKNIKQAIDIKLTLILENKLPKEHLLEKYY